MTLNDGLLREALRHGTQTAVGEPTAAWHRLSDRLLAARRRTLAARATAAAGAGLALVMLATPGLRVAAAELWHEVLSFRQGPATYQVVTGDSVRPDPSVAPESEPPVSGTLRISPDGSLTFTPAAVQTATYQAPTGEFPEAALADAHVPFRRPDLLPDGAVTVSVALHAGSDALAGSQVVRMSWEGGISVEEHTAVSRSSTSDAWKPSDAPRRSTIPTAPDQPAPEQRELEGGVHALRLLDGQSVSYYFSHLGTDYNLSGPVEQEALLLQMAQSLVE